MPEPAPRASIAARLGAARVALALAMVFPPAALATEIRFNCGGNAYARWDGRAYLADTAYPGSLGAGYLPGSAAEEGPHLPGGTSDHTLYRHARHGMITYRFDVPDGLYLLELGFDEFLLHTSGLRIQDVTVDSTVLLDSLDITGLTWKDYALDFLRPVCVTGGSTEVHLTARDSAQGWGALVSVIGLISHEPDSIPPPAPPDFTAIGGYARNILHWSRPADPDVMGYRIYRATEPYGPLELLAPEHALLERYYDDDVMIGEPYRYGVTSVDVDGQESALSSVQWATPIAPAVTGLQRFELTLDPDSLLALYKDPWSNDQKTAFLVLDGEPADSVSVRFRGGYSRDFSKKSWRVDVPVVDDTVKINLNAEACETSIKREYVTYELLRDLGMPTPLTSWAHLEVNGGFLGVFLRVERIGKSFLERTELDNGSSIYKCYGNLSVLDSLQHYLAAYEKETNEYLPHDDIIAFIRMINLSPPDSFPVRVAKALDLHEYFSWYTGIILVGDVDFTHRNYYLVHDLDHDRWRIVAWDLDFTFGVTYPYDRWYSNYNFCETPIDQGTVEHPGHWGGPNYLIDRLLEFPQFRWMYCRYLEAALDSLFRAPELDPIIDAGHDAITFDAQRDVFKYGWQKSDWFDDSPDDLKAFVACRREFLLAELETYRPDMDYPFRLNEFMAANDTTMADPYGEYDDWVEIVNISASPASLAGYHLNDDLDDPYGWAFPDTIVPAGGFVVVWADEDTLQGPLHAPFQIKRSGEQIALLAPVQEGGVVVDYVRFGDQQTDVSMGRRPDGHGSWGVLEVPSPGEPNGDPPIGVRSPLGGSVPRFAIRLIPNPHRGEVLFAPGNASLFAGTGSSRTEGDAVRSAEVRLFDSSGRLIRILPIQDAGVRWDGTDSRGRRVGAGVYFYEVRLPATRLAGRLVRIQ